jgi:hypothetical protein
MVQIHRSKGKLALLVAVGFGFAMIGLMIFLTDSDWIGLLTMVFFGLCGAVGIREFRKSEPAIEMDERGIRDSRSHLEVSWLEITKIDLFSYMINFNRQSFLRFEVTDYDSVASRVPHRWQRRIANLSRRFGARRFYLPLNMLDRKPKEIFELAERFHAAASEDGA